MTAEERSALCDQINGLVRQLRDDLFGPDLDKGKIVWPPNEDMSHADALTTLFDIADCDLNLTLYDETGNNFTDEWSVSFSGTQAYPNSPGRYDHKSLKAMIKEELELHIADDNADCPQARQLARLLKAFDEP